ncbi:hypothetical protein [Streptomyces sp. GC420]|nr:hypothetical protein [Streptomyces sp. GC420]NBM18081.1 hypothetical protein [Streptomyces sp. GC420]
MDLKDYEYFEGRHGLRILGEEWPREAGDVDGNRRGAESVAAFPGR